MNRYLIGKLLTGFANTKPKKDKGSYINKCTSCTQCGRNLFARTECNSGMCATCKRKLDEN